MSPLVYAVFIGYAYLLPGHVDVFRPMEFIIILHNDAEDVFRCVSVGPSGRPVLSQSDILFTEEFIVVGHTGPSNWFTPIFGSKT